MTNSVPDMQAQKFRAAKALMTVLQIIELRTGGNDPVVLVAIEMRQKQRNLEVARWAAMHAEGKFKGAQLSPDEKAEIPEKYEDARRIRDVFVQSVRMQRDESTPIKELLRDLAAVLDENLDYCSPRAKANVRKLIDQGLKADDIDTWADETTQTLADNVRKYDALQAGASYEGKLGPLADKLDTAREELRSAQSAVAGMETTVSVSHIDARDIGKIVEHFGEPGSELNRTHWNLLLDMMRDLTPSQRMELFVPQVSEHYRIYRQAHSSALEAVGQHAATTVALD